MLNDDGSTLSEGYQGLWATGDMSWGNLVPTRDLRETLQVLLAREIILHPSADGAERFLTTEVSGDYSGILRLCSVNKGGGAGDPTVVGFSPPL